MGSGRSSTACAMLKIAVTAPIATASIITTTAGSQPPRRRFRNAARQSCAIVMRGLYMRRDAAVSSPASQVGEPSKWSIVTSSTVFINTSRSRISSLCRGGQNSSSSQFPVPSSQFPVSRKAEAGTNWQLVTGNTALLPIMRLT